MTPKQIRKPIGLLKRWARTLAVVTAFGFLATAFQRSMKGAGAFPSPHVGWLAVAAALSVGFYVIQAYGWHLLLRTLGEPVSVRQSMRVWNVSVVARWMPGPFLYSAARLYIAREAGMSVTSVAVSTVLEISYVLAGSTVVTFLFAGALIPGLAHTETGRSLLSAGLVAMLVGGAVALRPQTLHRMCRFGLFRKVVRRLTGSELALQNTPFASPARALALLAYYVGIWLYAGLMFGMLAHAWVPMSPQRWMACIAAYPGSWLVGFLSIVTPAGLGVREGAMWLMLKPAMPHAQALILAATSRLMMLLTELAIVGVVYLIRSSSQRRGGRRIVALVEADALYGPR